ncbi:uncharacterized protein map3k19 isoform X2 [Salminus brasiliensis]|uniref:uncharacterized protein map3k19 isoform X2 n=1 Tax=Salminus brasiliensis TaxID=930266 RepID=UPI003B833AA4
MEEESRRGLTDLLLEGELEAVTLGLEQGLFSWDELDLPHNCDGSTPLISACQMGLKKVMHFLLDRGADATLCNHSHQTALHISPPDLQRELLAAIASPSGHKGQLLEAAWRGDITTLEHLLTQTDLADVNTQNQDGLTPLMLAVRDVDLFEGLQDVMPWDYRPTETVKALLAQSASVEVQDEKGHTVLHYASQIRSPMKNELLPIISESPSKSAPTHVELQCQFPADCSTNSLGRCPPPAGTSMEPRRSTRRGPTQLSKATGWTSSLPNLRDRNKCWDKLSTLRSPPEVPTKTSVIPEPPRLAEKRTTILQSPPVQHLSPLSQSAPSLALLDASALLQARENIYHRLSGETDSDSNSNQVQGPPPVLCPRTPKHLAPLDRHCRDGPVLSSLQRPLLLKPISISPVSPASRQRRERFARLSLRGSRGTRRGSAESASSSSSSESSVDFDEGKEEEENGPREMRQMFSTLSRKTQNILESPSTSGHLVHLERTDSVEHNDLTSQDSVEDREQEEDRRSVEPSTPDLKGASGKDPHPDQDHLSPANVKALHPASAEKGKPTTTKSKERKCVPFHTNQSFNILAHRNTNWSVAHPKRNRRNSTCSSQAKIKDLNSQDHFIRGEATRKLDCPKTAPTKQGQKHKDAALTRRKPPEIPHETKMNGDKKTLNKCHSQKELLNRELKTGRQPKKPGHLGSLRAKSALDSLVSYSDMFLQIHNGDKGPAIFEMFATPLYEHLREGRCAVRCMQVQPHLQSVKRPFNGQRAQKSMEGNRRKQPQKCSLSKSKQRKRRDSQPSRPQNLHQSSGMNKDNTVVISGLDGEKGDVCGTRIEDEGLILSVIEEVLSNSATATSIHPEKKDLASSSRSDAHKENWDVSSQDSEDVAVDKFPAEPMINTWTSGRTRSPVYQKFLDELGEGPVTDDLLRCLAEELISLEEKEVETLKSEHTGNKVIIATADTPKFKKVPNKGTLSSDNPSCTERSSIDETISWTKGEVLGRGAYGTVYCGLTSQGQLIAVKQVLLDVSTSETAENEYNRLEREVDLLKNLNHPNIVGFLGTALTDNVISIFMEYVPGGSISSVLNRFGPLPEKVFALYTRQILEGVAYLHDNRVIHRDLKGNNLMLMPTGIVKLIDFGCARRLNRLTHSGGNSDLLKSVHGTPYWMAPEVINESGHGKKSDIWSIGCTVFEMATGKPPLAHMGKMAALFYIGARKGLMPSLPEDFSDEARSFVKTCLTSNQKQRPSAGDLLRHPFTLHLRQPKNYKPHSHPNHV